MNKIILAAMLALASVATAFGNVHSYTVIVNVDESKLVLVDGYGRRHIVEAQTYCFEASGFGQGAVLISQENLDICVSATLINASTGRVCKVWC